MQLSVIIVNYNVKFFLEQCLYSVIKAAAAIDTEIIVVDNDSSDGSGPYIRGQFPSVIFIRIEENLGFGKANNLALEQATGDHVLFLNPDTLVPENAFSQCLDFFKQKQDCGALGVRMIDGSGRFLKESKRSLPSLKDSFFKTSGIAGLFPRSRYFSGYYVGHLPEKKVNEVQVLAGAFMMLSRAMITVSSGFDERFFMYAEDIDLSYRIREEGKRNYYFPEVTIIHFKGESTRRSSDFYIRNFYGAMQLYVQKHYPGRPVMQTFSRMAIGVTQRLASLKLNLSNRFSATGKPQPILQVVLICGQENFKDQIDLLKYSRLPYVLHGRVAIEPRDHDNNIGHLDNLASIIKAKKINTVIFCEADRSYETIISIAETLPPGTLQMFHALGSRSMVGSNDKNENGFTISSAS